MNKSVHLLLSFSLFLFLSCKKDTDNPADPPDPVDNKPLQLVKKVVRYEFGGNIVTDSSKYVYDEDGHMIGYSYNTSPAAQAFIYDGDMLTGIVTYVNGQPDTLKNTVKLLDNGNTIFMDFTRPGLTGGTDTIHITYKWSGNKLLESWTYLHFTASDFLDFSKTIISYDDSGNQIEELRHDQDDGTIAQGPKVLEYDQKKNYFNTTSRLDFVLMSWGLPYASRSVNNPTKIEWASGQTSEYVWTYNANGYPLTMKEKGKDYFALELEYNK